MTLLTELEDVLPKEVLVQDELKKKVSSQDPQEPQLLTDDSERLRKGFP